jgi:biopolymer transport protein ExbD
MRLPEDSEPSFSINIVPMIDVIFSILAFFIVSTLFLTRSEGLPVNLPGAVTSNIQSQSEIYVTIEASGTISLNRQEIELTALKSEVNELVLLNQSGLVIINADEAVSHGKVVAVMDQLRQIEGVRMAIAVKKASP